MKFVLSILIVICSFAGAYAQFGVTQTLGAPNTLVKSKGGLGADSGFIIPNFADTINAQKIKVYAGALIKVNNTLYLRDSVAQKWIPLSSTIINDTSNFSPVIDSTGNVSFRVLYAQGNKIVGSAYMTYDTTIREFIVTRLNSQVGLFDSLYITEPPESVANYDPSTDPNNFVLLWDATTGNVKTADWSASGGADSSIFQTNYRTDTMRTRINSDLLARVKYTDTAAMNANFVRSIYRRSDSVFYVTASGTTFAFKDSTGGGGSIDYVTSGLGIRVDSSGRVYTVNSDTANLNVISRQRAAATYAALASHNAFSTRNSFTSLTLNKDSVPISTTNIWALTLDSTGGVASRVQRRSLSGSFVELMGAQTVAGIKTFTSRIESASGFLGNSVGNLNNVAFTINGTFNAAAANGSIRMVPTVGTAGSGLVIQPSYIDGPGSGEVKMVEIRPTINAPSGGPNAFIGFDYNPTVTNLNGGTHYAALFRLGSIGIGTSTPDASSLLDITSTTRGFLPPRMNTTQQNAITSPTAGLFIYNSDSTGYMYYNGSAWARVSSGGGGTSYTAGNGIKIDGSNVISWADTMSAAKGTYFYKSQFGIDSKAGLNFLSTTPYAAISLLSQDLSSLSESEIKSTPIQSSLSYFRLGNGNSIYTNINGVYLKADKIDDGFSSNVTIKSDSIKLEQKSATLAYTPTTTSKAKYKAVLMDSTTGALVTISPDSLGGGGSGTVTSIATGLGLTGGTITTSGTVSLDTASASVISRQRAAATYITAVRTVDDSTLTSGTANVPVSRYARSRTGYEYFTEFIQGLTSTAQGYGNDVIGVFIGANAAVNIGTPTLENRPGIVRATTGTTTTGRAGFATGNAGATGVIFVRDSTRGSFEFEEAVNLTQLSTAADRYYYFAGFADRSNAIPQNGAYFLYDSTSTFWKIVSVGGNVATTTTTSTTVATGWTVLGVDLSGDSARYYINGVQVGSHGTNLPEGTAETFGVHGVMQKAAGTTGTTAMTYDLDYLWFRQRFFTARPTY